jgi:hypothetical protein
MEITAINQPTPALLVGLSTGKGVMETGSAGVAIRRLRYRSIESGSSGG